MKKSLVCLFLSFCAASVYAGTECSKVALPAAFSGCTSGAAGALYFKADKNYFAMDKTARAAVASKAIAAWLEANPKSKLALFAVKGDGMGELWGLPAGGKTARLDAWQDSRMNFGPKQAKHGNLFAYLGGQLVTGRDYPSKGFSARLGTMLFKDRYDAAVSYSYSGITGVADSGSSSIGLVGRARFKSTRHAGLNAGFQLNYYKSAYGEDEWAPSVIGGINVYVPSGSFDISASIGGRGAFNLQLGYTVFLSRR